MKKWKILHTICFLSCFIFLEAQEFNMQHYGVREGLPSEYLYDFAQDEKGYLWITTEAGICRYDGTDFDPTPILELAGEEAINIMIDSQSRIWFSLLDGRIAYYENSKTYILGPFYFIDSRNKRIKLQVDKMREDSKGRIWLLSKFGVVICIDEFKKDKVLAHRTFSVNTTNSTALTEEDDRINIFSKTEVTHIAKDTSYFKPYGKKMEDMLPISKIWVEGKHTFSALNHINQYIPEKNEFKRVFTAYNNYFKKGINSIYQDRAENIWVSTKSGLLLLKKISDGTFQHFHLLKESFIGLVFQDNAEGYWVLTQKEGLYYLPSISFNLMQKQHGMTNNNLSSIAQYDNNTIVTGSDDNTYNFIQFNENTSVPNILQKGRITQVNNEIYDIIVNDDKAITFFTSLGAFYMKNIQSKPEYSWLGSFKVAKKTENNVIWTGQSTIAQIKSGNKFTTILPDRTYAVEPLTENYGWIGSVEGLYLYDNGKLKKYKQEKLHVDIRDIKKMRDGKLWVATKSEGVFILENDEIIQQLNIKNGFPSNDVKKLYEDDSFIWIATGNGIAYLEKGDTSLQTISVENGLPPGQINDIIRIKDQIILATNRGMVYFNPDKISFERPSPTLEIRSIRINEKDTLITNNYELEYYEDNIKVAFRGIAFQISQPPNYQIKMDGLDENWLENTSGQAEYPSLSPGKYTLNIRSKIIGSEWSEIKQIQFIIESPYWKKLWFFALLILGFILLFVSIGYRIYKGIERDAEIKNKLRTYQMTALRAQMNPHFMFNSLNSIQQFILTQDKRAANKYLSNFAKLMRSILEMSDKEKISLDSEIEALGLYLELENLRFDNELDYKIEIDDNIDPKTKFLPSMLIQPYVENAIKHGLMHKESDRKLHIYFCMENEFLQCMIDDNGIGRETSKQIQKENKRTHQAKAMGLTEERLELLNKSSKKQLNVIIEDKYDNHKNSLGTKVVLFIKQD